MLNSKNIAFKTSLITLLIYELAMLVFVPDGLSLFKLLLTGLVWVSFFTAFYMYFKKFKALKRRIPWFTYLVLSLLFLWNVFGILRSIITKDGTITTLLGNVFTSLALLLPFAIIFSVKKENLRVIHRYFTTVLKIAVPIFFIFFILGGGSFNTTQVRILLLVFTPVIFLITLLPFLKIKDKTLVLICALLLSLAAGLYGQRTMFIRELSLFISLFALFLYAKYRFKWILVLSFLVLFSPFILLQQSVATGESVIEEYLSFSLDSDLKTDTRTFLYKELFEDLTLNEQLLIGKGANGSYYSEYFSNAPEESDYRNNIEVGVLGIMLKGGLIALLMNFAILFIAIFYAFFRSENTYVMGVGYMLVAHTVLLFVENYYRYSSDNYAVWFFIGICLSQEIRTMDNQEIRRLLYPKKSPK